MMCKWKLDYRDSKVGCSKSLMADPNIKDTSRTTDSIEATGLMASSASPPGLANKFLSSDTSTTAMAKFSLELRDLEAAAALEALGMVPETQWPGTEASTLEISTDSEVTFRKVLGSAEVLATRPGVDPLEVTRPLPEFSWTSQSPQATSPSVIVRQPTHTSPGPWPPVASHVFGPSTTQVDPDIPYRESRQTTHQPQTEDPEHFQKLRRFKQGLQKLAIALDRKYTQGLINSIIKL